MSQNKPVVVVLGTMGGAPFAGMAWQVLHHLEGFRRLGCEVYYLEDNGAWPYDPRHDAISADCTYAVDFIATTLSWCGMADRWAYRAASENNRVYGIGAARLGELLARASILINLTGATALRDDHMTAPVRVFLETDPVAAEIEVALGRESTIQMLAAHTHHFTYGENLGAADCGVPTGPFRYHLTRPPVILDWWPLPPPDSVGTHFTTIGNWKQSGHDIQWKGQTYAWSKHHEFMKFIDLPARTAQRFQLALSAVDQPTLELLRARGWDVTAALPLSLDIHRYRRFIRHSRGEFTVAKDQNIRLRSGWFSDRSACYLAAGRPVVTQDTGFGNILPTGSGLFPFATTDEAVEALDAINADYAAHCRAARRLAGQYFKAETVLGRMLQEIGVAGNE
jgi:hypothetical protein